MENRNQLRDVSIMDVMRDIESTEKTDYITDLNKVRLSPGTGRRGINAEFGEFNVPVNDIAIGQIESTLMPGFSTFGRNLQAAGMRDLYLRNANELISRQSKSRFLRMHRRPEHDLQLRACLSPSYKRYDDDMVFGSVMDAVSDTTLADQFRSIGGYRTDNQSYLKMVTREPLFGIQVDGRERNFSLGFIVSNSEVGQGFCKIDVLMIDHYCTNGCIFSSQAVGKFKVMHRGRNFDLVSGVLNQAIDSRDSLELERVSAAIRKSVTAALNKDLYLGYESAVRSAAALRIDDPEIYARVIGRHLNLREAETKAVAQRLIETGDRTLFGVQAALTDAAKYAETYDRKLELERCGGKIFTEIPSRWSAIQKLAESEKLDN